MLNSLRILSDSRQTYHPPHCRTVISGASAADRAAATSAQIAEASSELRTAQWVSKLLTVELSCSGVMLPSARACPMTEKTKLGLAANMAAFEPRQAWNSSRRRDGWRFSTCKASRSDLPRSERGR